MKLLPGRVGYDVDGTGFGLDGYGLDGYGYGRDGDGDGSGTSREVKEHD